MITNKVPDGALTTCYRCGPLIDLCRGPHLPSTGKVKAFSIEKHSSVYWLGNANNGNCAIQISVNIILSFSLDNLQRVYAISFPDSKLMKQYKVMVEEAKKRDHRTVGNTLNLFFFDTNLSPGCCFWLPDGAKIYNRLTEFIRVRLTLLILPSFSHRGSIVFVDSPKSFLQPSFLVTYSKFLATIRITRRICTALT